MADVERVDPVDASDELSYPPYRSQERILSNMTFELRGKFVNNNSIPLTSSSALLLFLDIRRKKLRTANLALFFDRPLSRPRRSDNEDESSSRMKSPSDIIPSRFCRSNDHRRHSLYERISQLILQRIDGIYSPIDSSSHQNSSLD